MRTLSRALPLAALALSPAAAAAPPWTAHGDRLTVLPAAAAGLPARARLAAVPERAWEHVARMTLAGAVATAPLVLADGGLVLALESPSSLLFLAPDGTIRASTRLDHRVARSPVAGADGRIFAVTEDRGVLVAAPDGTLRGYVPLAAAPVAPPLVRRDGAVVLVGSSVTMQGEVVVLSPSGDPALTRPLGTPVIPEPVLGADDTVFAIVPSGLLALSSAGEVTVSPLARSPAALAALGDGTLAAAAGNEVLLLSRRGALLATIDAGATVRWVAPVATGRLAALRVGPPAELWLATTGGAVLARTPVPASSHPPLVAPDGALVVVSREGDVVALGPDGAERWRLALRASVPVAPVAIPGGIAVCTASRELLVVR